MNALQNLITEKLPIPQRLEAISTVSFHVIFT